MDDHHMDQSLVVFDVPFQGTTMGGIRMPFDAFYLPIHSFGRLNEVLFVVGDACQGPIVKHKCLRIGVQHARGRCSFTCPSRRHSR